MHWWVYSYLLGVHLCSPTGWTAWITGTKKPAWAGLGRTCRYDIGRSAADRMPWCCCMYSGHCHYRRRGDWASNGFGRSITAYWSARPIDLLIVTLHHTSAASPPHIPHSISGWFVFRAWCGVSATCVRTLSASTAPPSRTPSGSSLADTPLQP